MLSRTLWLVFIGGRGWGLHGNIHTAYKGCSESNASYLRWCPTTSEVEVGSMTVEIELSHQYPITFCGSNGGSKLKDKPHSGLSCTVVTWQNEDSLNQLIPVNQYIMIRELCTEINTGFSELETICTTLVLWKLALKQKEHHMQVCQHLLT